MFNLIKMLVEVKRNLSEPLIITRNSKYKRGFKKHKNDKRVTESLKVLLKYLMFNKEVPNEFNDHALSGGNLKGIRSAHIKGQQVIILYRISDSKLDLLGLGSHTELGTM